MFLIIIFDLSRRQQNEPGVKTDLPLWSRTTHKAQFLLATRLNWQVRFRIRALIRSGFMVKPLVNISGRDWCTSSCISVILIQNIHDFPLFSHDNRLRDKLFFIFLILQNLSTYCNYHISKKRKTWKNISCFAFVNSVSTSSTKKTGAQQFWKLKTLWKIVWRRN
jgi:hypothetical protein